MIEDDKTLRVNHFIFSRSPGGESLYITTKFISNGDPITSTDGVYTNQIINLNSYGNSASINLFGIKVTLTELRSLADKLEEARNSIQNSY